MQRQLDFERQRAPQDEEVRRQIGIKLPFEEWRRERNAYPGW